MRRLGPWAPAAALAAALTACGGGGSDTAPRVAVNAVRVVGDSLSDSGTFGFKFTVQGAASLVYTERVAQSYGVALCPHYVATSASTFVVNPAKPTCSNFAIGGARINNFTGPTSPLSIVQQLKDAAATGAYGANELLLVDGGPNDAADLIGAFLTIPKDGGASYSGLLRTLLPAATVATALGSGASGAASIGATYLGALADNFAAAIGTYALGNGVQRVAILNVPGITKTPRFQSVLAGISAANGGGTAGATAAAQYESIFNGWIVAFNTELAAKFAGNPNVVVVDFYTSFADEYATPAQYSITNVTTPVCPITGTDTSGLPSYTFATCTDAALSATPPPTGATGGADWWRSYAFSDSFHPTPYGHDLLARYFSRALALAGWL